MSLPVVYIAGPYGDKGGYLAIDCNIAQAREAAAFLAKNGIGYLCPHLNSAHFEAILPDVPVDFWYRLDLRLMQGCDALLLVGDWEKSAGVQRELREFVGPVFKPTERPLLLDWADKWEGVRE